MRSRNRPAPSGVTYPRGLVHRLALRRTLTGSAAFLCLCAAHPTAARAATLDELAELRGSLGLSAPRFDSEAARVGTLGLSRGRLDLGRLVGLGESLADRLRERDDDCGRGGLGADIGCFVVPDGPLGELVARRPALLSLLADPRMIGASMSSDGSGRTAIAVRVDPTRRVGARWITTGGVRPDAADAPLGFCDGTGAMTLQQRRNGRLVTLAAVAGGPAEVVGVAGGRLVVLSPRSLGIAPLAYGQRYLLTCGAQISGDLVTSVLPVRALSLRFDDAVRTRERRAVNGAVARMPTLVRSALAAIPTGIRIATRSGNGVSYAHMDDSGKWVEFDAAVLTRRRDIAEHVVAHELGHILDFTAIDDEGMRALRRLFNRSSSWRRCWRSPFGSCVPIQEVFAEQFAFYVTGRRAVRSGYQVPPLSSRAAFGRVLRANVLVAPEQNGWEGAAPGFG